MRGRVPGGAAPSPDCLLLLVDFVVVGAFFLFCGAGGGALRVDEEEEEEAATGGGANRGEARGILLLLTLGLPLIDKREGVVNAVSGSLSPSSFPSAYATSRSHCSAVASVG